MVARFKMAAKRLMVARFKMAAQRLYGSEV